MPPGNTGLNWQDGAQFSWGNYRHQYYRPC